MQFAAMMVVVALAAEAPRIELAEASEHVGQEVTIEMIVASSRLLESGKFCFLNSRRNFTDKENFTVAITSGALDKFAERDVKSPEDYFDGKTIRVRGKVSLHRERPQILVEDPEQIVVVVKVK